MVAIGIGCLSLLPTMLPSMLLLSNDTEVFLLGDCLQESQI